MFDEDFPHVNNKSDHVHIIVWLFMVYLIFSTF